MGILVFGFIYAIKRKPKNFVFLCSIIIIGIFFIGGLFQWIFRTNINGQDLNGYITSTKDKNFQQSELHDLLKRVSGQWVDVVYYSSSYIDESVALPVWITIGSEGIQGNYWHEIIDPFYRGGTGVLPIYKPLEIYSSENGVVELRYTNEPVIFFDGTLLNDSYYDDTFDNTPRSDHKMYIRFYRSTIKNEKGNLIDEHDMNFACKYDIKRLAYEFLYPRYLMEGPVCDYSLWVAYEGFDDNNENEIIINEEPLYFPQEWGPDVWQLKAEY